MLRSDIEQTSLYETSVPIVDCRNPCAPRLTFLAGGVVAALVVAATVQTLGAQELSMAERVKNLGLPQIETLTFGSDYAVFMVPDVPTDIRNRAFRKLWSCPFFNKTDGLVNYAGDYSTQKWTDQKHASFDRRLANAPAQ